MPTSRDLGQLDKSLTVAALIEAENSRHRLAWNSSTAPSRSFVSRTRTRPTPSAAASTQFPPCEPEYEDLTQARLP